ncbi:Ig-like domain-containing protein [Vibrio penaeicida]|uniref:Ig-like domain-containing protein n=1 Tax=Vibrio penaeicida TaxID=104609 RepID=UPI0027326DAB|nr:Ig-like domain-containing protein [Vibrio penaeicida]MDP2573382.1 Ig-like domain-containing protein [Vibrio penaeicida]
MHLKTLLFTFLLSSLVSGCGGESSPSSQSNGNGNKPTTPGTQKPTKPTQPEHQVSAHELLPYSFNAVVQVAGRPHTVELQKFSVRQENATFYVLNTDKSSQMEPLKYIPEVRSYRGKVVGQPESTIVGYVDGNNQFYGRVFYGGIKSWEIKNLNVKTKSTVVASASTTLNRSPEDLKPISTSHVLPEPSLESPIPSMKDFYLQRADITFHATEDSYTKIFGKNLESAIGGMDYMANLLDYLFTRDALIRFSYPGGLITQKSGSVTQSTQQTALRNALKGKFSLFHYFTGPRNSGANAGLTSFCEFSISAWCTLHEVGHAFNLGHDIGVETNSVMGAVELIPTNAISVIKSSPAATRGTIVGALRSPISPNANIDHIDVSRDGQATINVLDNDFDANGPLSGGTIKIHSVDTRSLAYGNISWDSNGKVTYQAPKGFVGDDHFHYTIIDETGMKDESEVHVKVISDSRVAFFKKSNATRHTNLQPYNTTKYRTTPVDQVHNLAGKEQFISLLHSNAKYPNLGFTQQVLKEGGYDTVYEKNNTMALRDYMPHELAPGRSSFSVSLVLTQDGDFISRDSNGDFHKTIQELSLIGQGKLDDGYALSYFNGNQHRVKLNGSPAKGLGWTLVSRQFFTQQRFNQRPHEIHAFASPDSVTVNDNKPHVITWVINREANTVTTYVDGVAIPMALDSNPTHFARNVPLPADFGGIYPGGTHYWYSSGRDLHTESYGPWFMRTTNSDAGKENPSIWETSTEFLSKNMNVDNVQIFTYALSYAQVTQIAQGGYPAYTNSPYNGQAVFFDKPITLNWEHDKASSFKLMYGYEPSLKHPKFSQEIGAKNTQTVAINDAHEALYWRIDSNVNGKWVTGHTWSVRNQLQIGNMLSLSFTQDELTNSAQTNAAPWGKNIEEDFGNVRVKVSNQTDSNGRSTLLLRGDNANITFTSNGGREIKQLNVSLGSYNQEKVGDLAIQYRSGSQWKDAKVLHKNGLPTGQNYNGMYSHSSGVGNGKGGPGKNRYVPASTDNLSSYKVSFPSGVFEARIIVRGHKNVVAIIDHVTLM